MSPQREHGEDEITAAATAVVVAPEFKIYCSQVNSDLRDLADLTHELESALDANFPSNVLQDPASLLCAARMSIEKAMREIDEFVERHIDGQTAAQLV